MAEVATTLINIVVSEILENLGHKKSKQLWKEENPEKTDYFTGRKIIFAVAEFWKWIFVLKYLREMLGFSRSSGNIKWKDLGASECFAPWTPPKFCLESSGGLQRPLDPS